MSLDKMKIWSGRTFSAAALMMVTSPLFAQATFLIWPIYPKMEENEKATVVWLQNTGNSDAMVQIRVFKWNQDHQQDAYEEQTEVIPSPPVTKIKAGEKHMLRLTRSTPVPDTKELAYRVIIDELPIKLDSKNQTEESTVSFQMRYSIPLFTYGKGIGSGLTEVSDKTNAKNPLAKPILNWWVKNNEQGLPELYIKNSGSKFSRLSGIKLTPTSDKMAFGKTAFGYVLANSTMKFDLDHKVINSLNSQASLYGVDSSGTKQEVVEIKKLGAK